MKECTRQALICISVELLMPGCAMFAPVPEPVLPEGIPNGWSISVKAADLPITSGLLDLIGDPTAEVLVLEALEHNADLGAAALRLQASGFFLNGPRSRLLPTVNAGFSRGRNNQEIDVQTGGSATADSHRATLGFSLDIDIWGRLADQVAVFENDVQAEEWQYLHARDSLAARVVQVWIEQISQHRRPSISTDRVAVLMKAEALLFGQYEQGIGSLDDLSTARSRWELAQADRSEQQAVWPETIRRLEVLTGRYPRGKLATGNRLPNVAPVPTDIPAAVLLKRPDIQAALCKARAAGYSFRAAEKGRFPALEVSGETLRRSVNLGKFGNAGAEWAVLNSLLQPVFAGGRIAGTAKARGKEAEARREELGATCKGR